MDRERSGLKKVVIKGFQSHEDTEIELHPHLNIIVGPSDEGKSAILRALKKVIRDLPSGNDFINVKTDTCEVSVSLIDGPEITRKVSYDKKGVTKINEYRIQYLANEQVFNSFGREIPLEVLNALNCPIIELEDGTKIDLHFAGQHDAPFLLSTTPSARSKVLGRISGLHAIDRGIQQVNKDSRKITNEVKNTEIIITSVQEELAKFPDVPSLIKQTQILETLLETLERKKQHLLRLQVLNDKLNDVVYRGNIIKTELARLPVIEKTDFNTVKIKITRHNSLTQLKSLYTRINQQIIELNDDVILKSEIKSFDFQKLKDKCSSLENLKACGTKLTNLDTEYGKVEYEIYDLHLCITQVKNEWETKLRELGVCPTCKQPTREVNFK